MRSSRLAIAVLAVLGLTAGAAGCSSSSDDTPHGIVTASCTKTGITVQVTDPDNGKVETSRHFSLRKGDTSLLSCINAVMPGYAQRSALSKDLDTLAISRPNSGGAHLGTLKSTDDPKKTSDFTDLSGDDLGTVTQSNGAFGPDGKVYAFEQSPAGMVVKKFDPDNGKSEPAKVSLSATTTDGEGNTDTNQLYFLPRGKNPEANSRVYKVYSPDGTSGFAAPDDAHLQRFKDGKVRTYQMPHDPKVEQGGLNGYTTDPVAPVAYYSDDECLAVSQGGDRLYDVKFDLNKPTLKVINLKGLKGGSIEDVTPYNEENIAFIYRKDGQRTLYSAAIDGTSMKPKKIKELPSIPARTIVLSWG